MVKGRTAPLLNGFFFLWLEKKPLGVFMLVKIVRKNGRTFYRKPSLIERGWYNFKKVAPDFGFTPAWNAVTMTCLVLVVSSTFAHLLIETVRSF